MVQTQPALALEALETAQHPAEQLQSVRRIKNLIIGNRTKKELFVRMGIIPLLTNLLKSGDVELRVQSSTVLGSLAHGQDANVLELADSGSIPILFAALRTPNATPRQTEAVVRALKCIYTSPRAPRKKITPQHLSDLVALIQAPHQDSENSSPEQVNASRRIQELCASLLARLCDGREQQKQVSDEGVITNLHKMLEEKDGKGHEAALDALSSICRENQETARMVVQHDPVPLMLKLLQDRSPTKRFLATRCLTNLYRVGVIHQYSSEMKLTVLPMLVKLLSDTSHPSSVQEKAPLVLAYLVSDQEEMQKSACDLQAIFRLAEILQRASNNDRLKESALLSIASISSLKEECRKQVVEAKVLSVVVDALTHPSTGIRAAACQCTRFLSRSVKNLRTSLLDAGIAVPLFELLSDESIFVQTTASAAVCNIVLDFSPMKKTVLEHGGVEKLVGLVSSMDSQLRLNAVCALKNLLFQAESSIKDEVMKHLGYKQLEALMNDVDTGVQEQVLTILRNLACGRDYDIAELFKGFGEQKLMEMLAAKLDSHNDEIIIQQALYVMVNIATGNENHKEALMKGPKLLDYVLEYMAHHKAHIRVAAVWVFINLTWKEDEGTPDRIKVLQQYGFEEKLRSMQDDADLDVLDRVRTALGHMSSGCASTGAVSAMQGTESTGPSQGESGNRNQGS